jgi:hypothetical protein
MPSSSTMPSLSRMRASAAWMTADEICALYAVSPDSLALYRQRGTLASQLRGGRPVYDAQAAATIFRRRGVATSVTDERSFGRLGTVTLGEPALAISAHGAGARSHVTR